MWMYATHEQTISLLVAGVLVLWLRWRQDRLEQRLHRVEKALALSPTPGERLEQRMTRAERGVWPGRDIGKIYRLF